ncbi:hypothetical protein FOZ62_002973, partial [Perkinsus olseni]
AYMSVVPASADSPFSQCTESCIAHLMKLGESRLHEEGQSATPEIVHLKAAPDGTVRAIVGRSAELCDISLDSARYRGMLSRRHAFMEMTDDGQWFITDLKGQNGTIINGLIMEPERRHALRDGDVITFGRKICSKEFEYKFRVGPLVLRRVEPPRVQRGQDPLAESPERERPSTAGSSQATSRKRTRSPRSRSIKAKKPKRTVITLDSDTEDEAHSSELERQLDAMRQENERLKERLKSVSASPITPGKERVDESCKAQPTPVEKAKGRLFADLECIICRDLMVSPATLECSHSFCFKCIEEWLTAGNFRCPICRVDITRSPTKTLQLQQVLSTAIETHGDESEQSDYAARTKEHKVWEQRRQLDRTKLEDSIGSACQQGQQFLDIASRWSTDDRDRFQT